MTVTAPARTADYTRRLVEPAIRSLLDQLDDRNRRVAGYQFGYWDANGEPTTAGGGKGLRPALALLAARAAGAPPEAGVPAAAAVELVHAFSLLHDDVMDGDTERRHRPTSWSVFGQGPAILAGDALLTQAEEVLAGAPGGADAARLLRGSLRRLIAGQAADLAFEQCHQVTLEECLAMAADKTGALLAGACGAGALLGGGKPELVAGLSRFGERLGLAYQLMDDLLGIWGDPARTGKPVGADLRVRKKSLPVVWAVSSGSPAGRTFAELYRTPGPMRDAEVARAAELLATAGAQQWARGRIETETSAALSELRELAMPVEVHDELAGLAAFSRERDY